MSEAIIKDIQTKMDQAIQSFQKSLATVRAGRANPAILNSVVVDYYGATTPLNQLATINAPEARMLVVTPFDKSSIGEIEKGIQKADLGLAPSSDGNIVRIVIPPLTEERRKDLAKVVGKFSEESKVQIRNIRRDANDQLKKDQKDSLITEDELRQYQNDVQAETDKYIGQIDSLVADKEAEIMEV